MKTQIKSIFSAPDLFVPEKKYAGNKLTIYIFSLLLFCSCQKTVEVDFPTGAFTPEVLFSDQEGTNAAIAGMYTGLFAGNRIGYGYNTISLLTSLQADEMSYNGSTWDAYLNNSLLSNDAYIGALWSNSYQGIYRANTIMAGVSTNNLPVSSKNQAIGEALFIRALCYFYMVNFFGDVPLITGTSVEDNRLKGRTPAAQVYGQIIADLEQAASILPAAYPATARTRANKYAALALLARAYLYQKNYAKAEEKATEVIAASGTGKTYTLLTDLASVFLATSTETIFSPDPSPNGSASIGGLTVPNENADPNFIILPGLLNAFETGDKRRANWVGISNGKNYPLKYRNKGNLGKEYDVVLRLSEQYLIRAEARAQQNNLSGAQADIYAIRSRAGLADVDLLTQADALAAVAQERRVELFSEWAHRWFDLRRTGRIDAVIGALKPGLWQATDALYPIPLAETSVNYNLTQNPGY